MADSTTPWQMVADEVLAAMIYSKESFERVRYELGAMLEHFPPGNYRKAVGAIDALRMTDKPVHVTSVATDSKADLTWLSERFALAVNAGAKLNGDVLTENVTRMKAFGQAYAHHEVMRWGSDAIIKADTPEKRARVVSQVMTKLGLDMTDTIQEAKADDVAQRFEAAMAEPPQPTLITGVPWLTEITGGIGRGHNWYIAAAYKHRKSTLLRIMALEQAEAGLSVTIAAFEGVQRDWVADFIAMLAVRWLYNNGHWDKKDASGIPLTAISGPLLLRLGNNYKKLHPLKTEAINQGIQAFKALGDRLRIYDSQPKNGGLHTLGSLETIINRDIARYKADVVYVDHLQLIDAGGATAFEQATTAARTLQHIAASKNIAMVILAQLNEEGVKYTGKSQSPHISGGGAAPAAADLILRTGYPTNDAGDEDKTRLEISVGWARRGGEGGKQSFLMHQATGWLIPTDARGIDNSAVGLARVGVES